LVTCSRKIHHRFFFHFLGAGLDHHDAFGGADDHDVELALAHLGVGRVDDEVSAIDQADAHRADRAVNGMSEMASAAGCAVDAENVGIVLGVSGKHKRDDLGLARKPSGTAGGWDGRSAAGQDFALAGPPFALDEAAGDASAGVGVFAIIHGQGEESRCPRGDRVGAGGGENHVVANANNEEPCACLANFPVSKCLDGFTTGESVQFQFIFVTPLRVTRCQAECKALHVTT
jgi:hypothetical protein